MSGIRQSKITKGAILAGQGGKWIIIPSVSPAISSENEKLYWIHELKQQVSLYTAILSSFKLPQMFL